MVLSEVRFFNLPPPLLTAMKQFSNLSQQWDYLEGLSKHIAGPAPEFLIQSMVELQNCIFSKFPDGANAFGQL